MQQEKKIYHYKSNGKIVSEIIEQEWLLDFLYFKSFGKFLRKIFTRKFVAKIYALYQNSFLSKRKILPFIKKYKIQMSEFEKQAFEFKSFNDFFIRKLKPGIRNIQKDPYIFISPADSKLFVIENVSDDIKFFVKNEKFDLKTFLGDNDLAAIYREGSMLIFRLAPPDYHRFHFPVDCIPTKAKRISGIYESVNPIAYKAGVQPLLQNERCLSILKTEKFDEIIFVSVGAMLVGKIINNYIFDKNYKKGEEMGYFEFGGSTLVLLFKKGMISLKKEFIENSKNGFETEVKMGQGIN